ncbi:ABC transporter ATP-binding protein [Nonomuraea deserti]|uniref:ABC transporter ATP-binding protein n=1 Tax=Nonomuraea deserti TaxID=1848322 RepID=A0A4V2YCD4_9ACTN|nr:ABC transporter ATP-binding protein [Nonomuraea deserti]TDD11036.1 ABC transporter ATP-binding protein [Nonomuraea deserti]
MVLSVEGLTIEAGGRRPILGDVSLTVGRGEIVGLVGESGSGKSTLARSVLRLLPRHSTVSGRVLVAGDDVLTMEPGALRDLRATQVSMIYQDPRSSLNPVRRIGDFLTERMVFTLGRPKAEARARALELLAAVGLREPERHMRQYPHELSGGMLQRVVIAAALAADPALLLADEATSALDVTTQAETLALLRRVQAERELGMLFITHDLHLAAAFCDRVHVLYAGTLVESRPAKELFEDPRHPYTAGLLACTPELDDPRPIRPIPGRPPSLDDAFTGCPFAPRCPHATGACEEWRPRPVTVPGGSAACRLVEV